MKFYGEENLPKSWALSFKRDYSKVALIACDASTGSFICNMIFFHDGGKITIATSAKATIAFYGYDPFEHGNSYDEQGRLIIGG